MKRSGDELNFNEGEQGAKSRKMLNFTRADRDRVRVARLAMSLARKLQRTSVLNTGSLVGEILDLTTFRAQMKLSLLAVCSCCIHLKKHNFGKETGPFQHARLVVNILC